MKLRYAEIRMWDESSNPLTDPPSETVGFLQANPISNPDPEPSIAFAGEVIRKHWSGECACMS